MVEATLLPESQPNENPTRTPTKAALSYSYDYRIIIMPKSGPISGLALRPLCNINPRETS